MRIVLVGGAGFIGHNLALALKARGDEVTCIDSLSVNNLYATRCNDDPSADLYRSFVEERLHLLEKCGVPLIRMDARDYNLLSQTVAPLKPDIIVHLAAIAHITVANKEPYTTFDNSLRTLENSLDVARAVECGIVFFSSSTVYGNFSTPVITEDEELTPIGIYGNLKLAGERMCIAYNQTYGTPVTIIRPQALYGPRCISGRVTQVFIERAMRGESIEVHGEGEHDFTYIQDLIDGMKLVLTDWSGLRIYNLTGESATSLKDLARLVAYRFPTEIRYGPNDPDKPSRGTMSCRGIREEMGYVPRYDIKKGMNLYMDWYECRKTAKSDVASTA